ncbi:unnamed protein product [Polarella glacialis]|uniref:Uncharacterized protein n=1 Tax=Polarella glacialis TaxID=89957 RepID=A0A813EGV4_POLGL|nr:unnamed protein product [Polarella glacialis]CAE8697327.1 unnamed protein product [Polarella glacialis]
MAYCPYGKASLCFPLSISRDAAMHVLHASESAVTLTADVVGLTTRKTHESGAASIRLELRPHATEIEGPTEQVAHLVAVRVGSGSGNSRSGWLPGLAGMRRDNDEDGCGCRGMEVIVMARPNSRMDAVMYLPEATLDALFLRTKPGFVEVRLIRELLPVQYDCPAQWLRDRLLRLADMVDTEFEAYGQSSPRELEETLKAAGLVLGAAESNSGRTKPELPADAGNRVSQDELGYWDEEMRLNTRCAAGPPGRLDGPDSSFVLDGQ